METYSFHYDCKNWTPALIKNVLATTILKQTSKWKVSNSKRSPTYTVELRTSGYTWRSEKLLHNNVDRFTFDVDVAKIFNVTFNKLDICLLVSESVTVVLDKFVGSFQLLKALRKAEAGVITLF